LPPASDSCSVCSSIAVTDAEAEAARRPGLLASLRRLAATFVEILQTRIELVATELEEERARIRDLLLYGLLTLFFVSVGLLLLTAYVVILYWDTHRLNVVGAFAVFYGGAGIIAGLMLWRRIKSRPRLFSSTLSELSKDRNQLRGSDQ
jgi:uncharacterized membrane protein YqjE